jgi:hypothetical protein
MQNIMVNLTIAANSTTEDLEELADRTVSLRNQLLGADIRSVDFARDKRSPEGARVVDPVTIGTLLITMVGSGVR